MLDLGQVRSTVGLRRLVAEPYFADPFLGNTERIASRAETLARWQFARPDQYEEMFCGLAFDAEAPLDADEPLIDPVECACCAGLMIYAMDHYGMSYEVVSQLTNSCVADAVAVLSGSLAMRSAQRHAHQMNQMHAAQSRALVYGIAAVTRIAELETICAQLDARRDWHAADPYFVMLWCDRGQQMLDRCEHRLESRVQEAVHWLRRSLIALHKTADQGLSEIDPQIRRRRERRRRGPALTPLPSVEIADTDVPAKEHRA